MHGVYPLRVPRSPHYERGSGILGERHLYRAREEYLAYYHLCPSRRSLAQDCPDSSRS